jgi:hypothetical protein
MTTRPIRLSSEQAQAMREHLTAALAILNESDEVSAQASVPRDTSNISAGVAESWKDEDTREKRSRRWACEVDGVRYSSTHQAYLAIYGPDPASHHISWRGRLVEAAIRGEILTDEDGRIWRAIDRKGT